MFLDNSSPCFKSKVLKAVLAVLWCFIGSFFFFFLLTVAWMTMSSVDSLEPEASLVNKDTVMGLLVMFLSNCQGHGQIPLKVPNVKFDFDVKFLMYVLGTACCQQLQIHQKRNILICTL